MSGPAGGGGRLAAEKGEEAYRRAIANAMSPEQAEVERQKAIDQEAGNIGIDAKKKLIDNIAWSELYSMDIKKLYTVNDYCKLSQILAGGLPKTQLNIFFAEMKHDFGATIQKTTLSEIRKLVGSPTITDIPWEKDGFMELSKDKNKHIIGSLSRPRGDTKCQLSTNTLVARDAISVDTLKKILIHKPVQKIHDIMNPRDGGNSTVYGDDDFYTILDAAICEVLISLNDFINIPITYTVTQQGDNLLIDVLTKENKRLFILRFSLQGDLLRSLPSVNELGYRAEKTYIRLHVDVRDERVKVAKPLLTYLLNKPNTVGSVAKPGSISDVLSHASSHLAKVKRSTKFDFKTGLYDINHSAIAEIIFDAEKSDLAKVILYDYTSELYYGKYLGDAALVKTACAVSVSRKLPLLCASVDWGTITQTILERHRILQSSGGKINIPLCLVMFVGGEALITCDTSEPPKFAIIDMTDEHQKNAARAAAAAATREANRIKALNHQRKLIVINFMNEHIQFLNNRRREIRVEPDKRELKEYILRNIQKYQRDILNIEGASIDGFNKRYGKISETIISLEYRRRRPVRAGAEAQRRADIIRTEQGIIVTIDNMLEVPEEIRRAIKGYGRKSKRRNRIRLSKKKRKSKNRKSRKRKSKSRKERK